MIESGFAEAYTTHWQLPESVFARLGKGWVTDFDFSPDGSHLAVASSIGIWIYETTTYQEVALITEHAAILGVIPDGKRFASGSPDGTVLLWDVPQTLVIYEHADK